MTWQAISIEDQLRAVYPHGDPQFIKEVIRDVELHSRKNADYAAGGDPLGNFKRVSSLLSNYPDLPLSSHVGVALVYMLKQLDAVLWNLCQKHELNESAAERWRDITVYSVIIRCMLAKQ